ncbi:MAG: DNA repair protein RadA [Candidatus Margulisbacteria bacterium]|nr:DNA repair protein RadA [Candidatus Margulisiibacteriota bacterium]
MVKTKSFVQYICQSCGGVSPQWMGKCPECGAWNTLVEEIATKTPTLQKSISENFPQALNQITIKDSFRFKSGILEFDRVLGGGLVEGSVILLGGDPGIGKSTLSLQIAAQLSQDFKILYISGEESAQQIKLRAERLNILTNDNLLLLNETNLFSLEKYIKEIKPALAIIDSIQTTFREDLPSAPGSVGQVRECAAYLTRLAKNIGSSLLFVGHVTKEGAIAGPKVLEHMVDTVLYLEGERHQQFRILRGIKNRFGSTNEIGIFEMQYRGLAQVKNPSQIFLQDRPKNTAGSVVVATIEGSRPLLVEIQALVSPAGVGIPRRTFTGVDSSRAAIVVATLEKKLSLHLYNHDIFINVTGGVYLDEPAADLGIALAIISSFKNIAIPADLIAAGEIGLGGEIRSVGQIEKRVAEAEKLGFKKFISALSYTNTKSINCYAVKNIREALDIL